MGKYVGEANPLGVPTVEEPISFEYIEKSLSGHRDPDLKILSYLDDTSLLNFCVASKYGAELCKYEHFWQTRLIDTFGNPGYKPTSWKNLYLSIIHYLHQWPIMTAFGNVNYNPFNSALYHAAQDRNMEMVQYFISKGADDWGLAIQGAAESGDAYLVNYFIEKMGSSATVVTWTFAAASATKAGHKYLVDFFYKKGADLNAAIYEAIRLGNLDMLKYLLAKGHYMMNLDNYVKAAKADQQFDVFKYLSDLLRQEHHKRDMALKRMADMRKSRRK